MPRTPTPPPKSGRPASPPVPTSERAALRSLGQAITDGATAANRRSRLMCDLHARGHSLERIAEAAGVTRERVRQVINATKEADANPDSQRATSHDRTTRWAEKAAR